MSDGLDTAAAVQVLLTSQWDTLFISEYCTEAPHISMLSKTKPFRHCIVAFSHTLVIFHRQTQGIQILRLWGFSSGSIMQPWGSSDCRLKWLNRRGNSRRIYLKMPSTYSLYIPTKSQAILAVLCVLFCVCIIKNVGPMTSLWLFCIVSICHVVVWSLVSQCNITRWANLHSVFLICQPYSRRVCLALCP